MARYTYKVTVEVDGHSNPKATLQDLALMILSGGRAKVELLDADRSRSPDDDDLLDEVGDMGLRDDFDMEYVGVDSSQAGFFPVVDGLTNSNYQAIKFRVRPGSEFVASLVVTGRSILGGRRVACLHIGRQDEGEGGYMLHNSILGAFDDGLVSAIGTLRCPTEWMWASDPTYFTGDAPLIASFYDSCSRAATGNGDGCCGGLVDMGIGPSRPLEVGVVCRSGMGDGSYPLYLTKDAQGNVMEAVIDFLDVLDDPSDDYDMGPDADGYEDCPACSCDPGHRCGCGCHD